MKLLIAISLLVLAVLPATASASEISPRIVGGTAATQGTYPAQAELDIVIGQDQYLCGGTLVAPKWVLTAGHCVTDDGGNVLAGSAFTVRLGSTTLGAGAPSTVDDVERAPGYVASTQAYDAALLHLSAPAPETPLALAAAAPAAGTSARVIGWGTTTEDGQVSPTLEAVDVPVVSSTTCRRAYPGLTGTALCAGYADGGRDACQGDSGGPLMVASGGVFALAAVVSGGDGCAEPGRYGIYTDMANATLRRWFTATTGTAAATTTTTTPATATTTATTSPSATTTTTAAVSVAPAAVRVATKCTRTACAFAVRFASAGRVRAEVTVSRTVARRLGLHRRRLVTGTRSVSSSQLQVLRLVLPAALRHRLAHHHLHSVRARFHVVATPASGTAATSAATVRLHR